MYSSFVSSEDWIDFIAWRYLAILRNDKVATLDVLKQGAVEHRSQRDQKNKNVAEQYVIP